MSKHVFLVLFGVASVAVGWAESSVWRAQRKGEVVYLGGTCHLLRASDFPLPAEFDAAYAASDTLYFETDLERMMAAEVQASLLSMGMLTDGTTLREHLSAEAWTALEAHCRDNGLPLQAFAGMKPWMITVTLAVLEWQKHGAVQDGVDVHFHGRAKADGKATRPLESIEAHLQFIASMGEGQESEMVLSTLQDLETTPRMVSELIAAWRAGDIETLDREMLADMREEFPQVYATMVVDRNRAWLPQILAMLEAPGTEYVLVGVGHFGGEEGLLALLRDAGVTVEALEPAAVP